MAEDTKKDAQPKAAPRMVTLSIDGRSVSVPQGTTVLLAARSLGIHIPTFCWHPKLKSVGACRMCYVEIEKWLKLAVSCDTQATEGMVVHTNSDLVKRGRRAVLEFILLNHPLDCPTCDKGGECDLQNLTFAHGIDDSRFDFQKYRFVDEGMTTTFDDKRIGPEIWLNRNRCILCYKCVRANKEAFGEYDLGVYERGNITEINAAPGQQLDNPFSGNLVEICPVGALTNSDWRYKIRVWLTRTTPSVCNFTSSGSNILLFKEDHKNRIYRTTARRNDDIDDGWLPDISRYGYQIANSADRLGRPLIKKGGKQVEASWDEAIQTIAKRFGEIKEKKGRTCIGGLVAPNLDNLSLYAFSRFFRTVLGSNNVDFRCDYPMLPESGESICSRLCSQPFRIADIDDSDVMVVFGSDLVREHPNEYLRMRKARNFGNPRIYSVNPYEVKSADIADLEIVHKPGTAETAVIGICLAAIESGLVDPALGAELKRKAVPATAAEAAAQAGVELSALKAVAEALAHGSKITIIIGELIMRSREREIIGAALANLIRLFHVRDKGQAAVLAFYANSRGADQLGLVPVPAEPTRRRLESIWGRFPDAPAHTTDSMMAQMKKEEIRGFFILGANPMQLYPDRAFVAESLEKSDFLVVCDLFETDTTHLADVVLPLCSWTEYDGDYVNLEGRVQRAGRAIRPVGEAKPGYAIVNLVASALGQSVFAEPGQLQPEIDQLLAVDTSAPLPDEFVDVKPAAPEISAEYPLPVYFVDDPHHRGHLTEKSLSLVNFAGDPYVELSPGLAARYGLSNGDSVRVESEAGKIVLPVRISGHLESDAVLLPRNFSSEPVNSLLVRKKRVNSVRIARVDE